MTSLKFGDALSRAYDSDIEEDKSPREFHTNAILPG
jgi:hypothetical protein